MTSRMIESRAQQVFCDGPECAIYFNRLGQIEEFDKIRSSSTPLWESIPLPKIEMGKAVGISREMADDIIRAQLSQPKAKCVICYAGQWYDIRGMTDIEIDWFVRSLVGDNARSVDINI